LAPPVRISLTAAPLEVRRALAELRGHWEGSGVPADLQNRSEQVLAEALNNIVEHAHAARSNGQIELTAGTCGSDMVFDLRDDGQGMPDGGLPQTRLAPASGRLDTLPEGGFGWFLIRELASDIAYGRQSGWNSLRFRVPGQVARPRS
jgi:serine/threonine-protein kinase RsbW